MTFNLYPSSILLTFTSHFSSVVKEIIIIIIIIIIVIIIYRTYIQPLDVCGMGRAGSVAKLMACAILNDCMVCPAQENEAVALSNNS